jgi:pimeloyl-ACP methyl ester carboxylesterase
MLHVPEGISGRIPVVCMFHGFTGNRMETHFLFARLSRELEKEGIASLRVDLGGSGESDGEFFDVTISGEVEDAKAILAHARSLDFADADRIALIGLSMGGVIASMTAGDCKEQVRALCLWAPACNMRQIFLGRDTLNQDFTELSEAQKAEMMQRGWKDFSGLALSVNYLTDLDSLDLIGRAAAYDKNVLIVHGDRDVVVPISNSDKYLQAYGGRARLHAVGGADHTFSGVAWIKELFGQTVPFLKRELLES